MKTVETRGCLPSSSQPLLPIKPFTLPSSLLVPQEECRDYAIYATPLHHIGDSGKLAGEMAICYCCRVGLKQKLFTNWKMEKPWGWVNYVFGDCSSNLLHPNKYTLLENSFRKYLVDYDTEQCMKGCFTVKQYVYSRITATEKDDYSINHWDDQDKS